MAYSKHPNIHGHVNSGGLMVPILQNLTSSHICVRFVGWWGYGSPLCTVFTAVSLKTFDGSVGCCVSYLNTLNVNINKSFEFITRTIRPHYKSILYIDLLGFILHWQPAYLRFIANNILCKFRERRLQSKLNHIDALLLSSPQEIVQLHFPLLHLILFLCVRCHHLN